MAANSRRKIEKPDLTAFTFVSIRALPPPTSRQPHRTHDAILPIITFSAIPRQQLLFYFGGLSEKGADEGGFFVLA
jgi:hypothetical protein